MQFEQNASQSLEVVSPQESHGEVVVTGTPYTRHTYIQSGNILFKSEKKSLVEIEEMIEMGLSKRLKNKISVLIHTEKSYKKMMDSSPKNWGKDTDKKYNALFIIGNENAKNLMLILPKNKLNAEKFSQGDRVVFWESAKDEYKNTFYAKELAKHPLYKKVTIRNSNTSLKLYELFDAVFTS